MLRFYNKKRFDIRKVIFYINLLVFLCSAGYLSNYYFGNYQNRSKIDALNKQLEGDLTASVDEDGNIIDRYASIRDEYPDLCARLTYNYWNKEILLPVMQTMDDNEYYLYRDIDGNDSKAGTPFIDNRCDIKDSMLLIIYGHNMKDMSQFGATKEYANKSYIKKYPTIKFETQYEEAAEYEVFAAFYSPVYEKGDDVFKYYSHFSLDTEEEYNYFVENVKELSLYDSGITPEYGEKLIVLSTCDYEHNKEYKESRFAVVARKTENIVDDMGDMEDMDTDTTNDSESTDDTETENTDNNDDNTVDDSDDSNVSNNDTPEPTVAPEPEPTVAPTPKPEPTAEPQPTVEPEPEPEPTVVPTEAPEPEPTVTPTEAPPEPTEEPSQGNGDQNYWPFN